MPRPEQIEIVATAIRRAFELRVKRPKPRPWHLLPEDVREAFRIEALAAIEAYESTIAEHAPPSPVAAPL